MSLSSNAIQSLTAEATGEVWLVLLTIEHDDLDDPIRIVNNTIDIVSNEQTFIALPFEIELPDEGERAGEARIRVDNVSRDIVLALREIMTPPTVKIQIVLGDAPDTIEMELPDLTLRDATYDAAHVTGYLRFEDLTVEPVAERITPERFPGLF